MSRIIESLKGPERVKKKVFKYKTIQYNIRLLGLDKTQANNAGSGYA